MTTVRIDTQSLNGVQLILRGVQSEAPKILSRALNATATKGRTEVSKAIRSEVKLSASYVRSRLSVRKASFRELQAKVSAPSRGLLLSRFSTQANIRSENVSWIKPPPVPARGIKVKVSPTSGAKTITGDNETKGKPFYLALPNGRLGIAARRKTAGPRGGTIKVFHGPSLSQVFNNIIKDVRDPLGQYQEEQVSKQIDSVLRGF